MVSSKPSGHLLKKKKKKSWVCKLWGPGAGGGRKDGGGVRLKMEHLVRCSEIEIEQKIYGFG